MDCPTCGLLNPPESLRCDCGYDFQTKKAPETPGWPITLGWAQNISVYWSITWPAMFASYLAGYFWTGELDTAHSLRALSLVSFAVFCGSQALVTMRLARKNYRSFRVYVVHHDGTRGRRLSFLEGIQVWLLVFAPLLALILIEWLLVPIATLIGVSIGAVREVLRKTDFLFILLGFLVIGPCGVELALRAKYPRFKLQALGFGPS